MNVDTLRLSLAVCGVIVVFGIYLYDRLRRKRARAPKHDPGRDVDPPVEGFSLKATPDDAQTDCDLPSMRNEPFEYDPLAHEDSKAQSEPDAESRVARPRKPSSSADFYRIVQLKVTSRKGRFFSGPFLISSLGAVGLEYGDMNIFHKHSGKAQNPVFSVANLLEPGTFPVKDASQFESPGVTLFLQIAVSDQPLAAFDDMLRTARMLAARIDGEIRDGENQLLTVEKAEAIRKSLAASG